MAERPADRYPDAGRLYDVLLAFLYKRGRSFGAADLAEFVSPFRTGDLGASSGSIPLPAAPHADANALRSDSDVSREESVS